MAEPVAQIALEVGALKLVLSTLAANAARAGASNPDEANAHLERLRQETAALIDTMKLNNTSGTDNAAIEAELRRQVNSFFGNLNFSAD